MFSVLCAVLICSVYLSDKEGDKSPWTVGTLAQEFDFGPNLKYIF